MGQQKKGLGGKIRGLVDSLYFARLARTEKGRAFLLSFLTDAEESDEAGVFDALLARVDDRELQKMVRVHKDDEVRHAAMFRDAATRAGLPIESLPDDLRVVFRIDRHAGGLAGRFVAGELGVMEAYLLLQVIEERAVKEYPVIADAMRPHDPASAAVVDQVVRDEGRHVKYARAISRRYAPDAATLERTLARYRLAEARAFEEQGRAVLTYAVQRGLMGESRVERFLWRAVGALG